MRIFCFPCLFLVSLSFIYTLVRNPEDTFLLESLFSLCIALALQKAWIYQYSRWCQCRNTFPEKVVFSSSVIKWFEEHDRGRSSGLLIIVSVDKRQGKFISFSVSNDCVKPNNEVFSLAYISCWELKFSNALLEPWVRNYENYAVGFTELVVEAFSRWEVSEDSDLIPVFLYLPEFSTVSIY